MSFFDTNTAVRQETPATAAPTTSPKGYVVLPPEVVEPVTFLSAKLVAFAVVVFAAATVAGLVRSGRLEISGFGVKPAAVVSAGAPVSADATTPVAANPVAAQKPVMVTQKPVSFVANAAVQPVKPVAPSPTLPAGTFTVSSISVGNPSFAIINGTAKVAGDAVEANGVTGWSVRQITESTVVLQNGSGVAELPLTSPGLNPLNDKLNPLN
jgi:hypothetical protein